MIRLILLLALLLALAIIIQQLKNTPKAKAKEQYWKIGFGALAVALILLAVTGRIHWIGALFGALLPVIRNALPLLLRFLPQVQQHYQNKKNQQHTPDGQQSEVTTRLLKMTMDHDTQQLRGEVISGPFAGQQLDALELEQLQDLLDYCQQQDQDSCQLLVSYLNHRFGNQWQQRQQQDSPQNAAELSLEEAFQILGLQAGASKEEIISAHKKLIQKVHPDRGGNDYLAAKINRAKDILLDNLG